MNVQYSRGLLPNSASVNEELGQIEYILSDETGILTQNKMVLRGIFVVDRFFRGKFLTKGVKKIFEPYLVEERAKKRILGDLDELFDIELSKAIELQDMEPLPMRLHCATIL